MRINRRYFLTNYLFILPAVIIFSIFYIYPFFKVFQLSLAEWDGVTLGKLTFVGLRNFKELIFCDSRHWWTSMWQAGYITLWALTFQNVLALLLALACDRAIRGGTLYRVIFFIPPVLSEVVVGLVWWWIYDGNWGLLNHWLSNLGLAHLAKDWLAEGRLLPLSCVAIVHCWKGFGWAFIILLAGLQSIPRQIYEAARVDGAGIWQTFWRVTFPLLGPVMLMVVILTILGSMQGFVLILAMTRGGPYYYTEVPVTRILTSMQNGHFGFACAQALIFGLILVTVSFTLRQLRKLVVV